MTDFGWRLSTRGDSRRADGSSDRAGFADLLEVVDAAELAGLDEVVVPQDPQGYESWVVAGAALRATRHLRIVAEVDPRFGSPVYAAKVSATLQRLSRGRLSWRVSLTVDEPGERLRRIGEFLTVARGVWNTDPVESRGFEGTGYEFDGEYYSVAGGGFRGILSGLRFPRIQVVGDTDAAVAFSARYADLHVFGAGSIEETSKRVAKVRAAASRAERDIGVAVEFAVTTRETADEARSRLGRLAEQAGRRDAAGWNNSVLWAGESRSGTGDVTAVAGSYADVAQYIRDLRDVGVDSVVLHARPQIEEILRVGEHLAHRVDPAGRALVTHSEGELR